MYVSYYFWGNCLGGWLAYRYFIVTQLWQQHNTVSARRRQWRLIQMFLCGWVGGFLANFILNLLFPAVSPRIHMRLQYVNEIRGFWLADSLRSAIQGAAANTFSAFPSGHCGLSWLVPIFAHRMGYSKYRTVTIAAAALISTATLVLRYHYLADFLFSVLVLYFAAWFGGFHTAACYAASLRGDERDVEKDNKGRRYDGADLSEDDEDNEAASRVPLMEVAVDRAGAGASPAAPSRELPAGAPPGSLALASAGLNGVNGSQGLTDGKRGADGGGGGSGAPGRPTLNGIAEGGHEDEGASSDEGAMVTPPPRLPRATSSDSIRLTSSSAVSRQSTGEHSKGGPRE